MQANLLDLARHHHALAQKRARRPTATPPCAGTASTSTASTPRPRPPATRLLLADLLFEGARYAEAAARIREGRVHATRTHRRRPRRIRRAGRATTRPSRTLPEAERPALRLRAIDSVAALREHVSRARPETPAVLTRTTKESVRRRRSRARRSRGAAGAGARPARRRRPAAASRGPCSRTRISTPAAIADAERAYGEMRRAPAGGRPAAGRGHRAPGGLRLPAGRGASRRPATRPVPCRNSCAWPRSRRPRRPAPRREFDAATLLLHRQAVERRPRRCSRISASAHPQHELQPDVTRKLAVAYLESGRRHEAAAEFERVAARDAEDAEVRRAALWQAAELYGAGGDRASATRAYAEYVKRFPGAVRTPRSKRARAGRPRAEAGRPGGAQALARGNRRRRCGGGAARTDRSRFLAANAALELARPLDAAARAIRLVIPLDKSLRAKRKAMEAALGAYARGRGLRRRRGHDRGHATRWPTSTATSASRCWSPSGRAACPPRNSSSTTCCSRSRRSRSRRRRSASTRRTRSARPRASTTSGCRRATPNSPRCKPGATRGAKSSRPGCAADATPAGGRRSSLPHGCRSTRALRRGARRCSRPRWPRSGQRGRAQPARRRESPARPLRGRARRLRAGASRRDPTYRRRRAQPRHPARPVPR